MRPVETGEVRDARDWRWTDNINIVVVFKRNMNTDGRLGHPLNSTPK